MIVGALIQRAILATIENSDTGMVEMILAIRT
jgi:hypothetical protein